AGELPIVGEAVDAVVDVAARLVGEVTLDQLLDQSENLRYRLTRLGLEIGPAQPEISRVLDVPARRLLGKLATPPRRGRVDLVVDVGDVVHERRVVAAGTEPRAQPHADDE